MGVDIDTARHDNLAFGIDDFCRRTDFLDNLAVFDGDITDFSLDLQSRIEDKSTLYDKFT